MQFGKKSYVSKFIGYQNKISTEKAALIVKDIWLVQLKRNHKFFTETIEMMFQRQDIKQQRLKLMKMQIHLQRESLS